MATLTYADQATVKNQSAFIDRCSIAVAKYAKFIIGEDPATQYHTHRALWATQAMLNPMAETQKIIYFAVLDPAVSGLTSPPDQTQISDSTLQSVVETAINNTILKF